ncbi:MAG TPA: arsenic resistance N-acetyltransferase ArsN2 [Noviherbaspirillum sp.]
MSESTTALPIRPLTPSTDAATLLERCGLPVADLAHCPSLRLFGVFDGPVLQAMVGLEAYPPVALLRSLAVVPERRDAGLGKRLVEFMENHARAEGIEALYLLTTTAAPFFTRLGYDTIARDTAPDAIRTTAQFAGLCPASSTFMVKHLPP